VKIVSVRSTLRLTSRHTNLSEALRISTPGSNPVSVSTWKPLQMPSTGVPALALATTSRMMGECAAMAPHRR
jgi:hypothetical protein